MIKANRIFENYICYILYGIFHFLFPTEKKSIHLNFFQLCFNFKVDGHYFAPLLFSFDFVLFRLCTSHSWVFWGGGRGAGSLFCFTLLYYVFLANCLWVIKLLLIHINIVIYIYIYLRHFTIENNNEHLLCFNVFITLTYGNKNNLQCCPGRFKMFTIKERSYKYMYKQ